MKKELDEKLCKDYPEIFRDRHGNMMETAMCWGFECDSGWYPLINYLCKSLMADVVSLRSQIGYFDEVFKKDQSTLSTTMLNYYTQENFDKLKNELEEAIKKIPIATQVKEKFGGLCFYVIGATDENWTKINFAEQLSHTICEECGSMVAQTYTIGWYRTLCDRHADKNYGKDRAEEFRSGKYSENF